MRTIILAGGKGTRLKPYTVILPKPLVPLGGEMPVLEVILRQLRRQAVRAFVNAARSGARWLPAVAAPAVRGLRGRDGRGSAARSAVHRE